MKLSKTNQIKQLIADNNLDKALSIVSKFRVLFNDGDLKLIKLANDYVKHPKFYKQLNCDLDIVIENAKKELIRIFI